MQPEEAISEFKLGVDSIASGISTDLICPECGCRDGLWAEVDGRVLLTQHGDCSDFQFNRELRGGMRCAACGHEGNVEDFTVRGLDKALMKIVGLT